MRNSDVTDLLKQENAPAGSPTQLTQPETVEVAGGAPGDHGNGHAYGYGGGEGLPGNGKGLGSTNNNENGRF